MTNTFKNIQSVAVGVVDTTVYTTPALTKTIIISMTLTNVSSGLVNVTATMVNGGTITNIVKSVPIPAGGALIIAGGNQKLVLEAGFLLKVVSDTAASVDVTGGAMEIT